MQESKSIDLLGQLLDSAKQAGAGQVDALLIDTTDLSVSQRLAKPEVLERSESAGISIRVWVEGKSAVVSSSDLRASEFSTITERVVAMARASIPDPSEQLAAADLWVKQPPELDLYESQEPPLDWLREQCARTEDTARATAGITNSEGAEMSVSRSYIALATSTGFCRGYRSSSISLSTSVLAGSGDDMQRDYAFSVARHAADLRTAEAIGQEAADRALQRLNARKVTTQQVPVVFEPRVGRSLLSNFASAISGQSVARGTSFLKESLHQPVFNDTIRIVDDPHRHRGLGSKPFDAEGVANQRAYMVKDGILQDWLLDTRTAAQLSMQQDVVYRTNGHASRGLGGAPSPAPSNLYIEPSDITPAALMADIKQGLYVTDLFGMGVNLINGDYSQGAQGFWIENGKIAYPVTELTIAGDLRSMFASLMVANDLQFDYGINVPTIRVAQMTVAGV